MKTNYHGIHRYPALPAIGIVLFLLLPAPRLRAAGTPAATGETAAPAGPEPASSSDYTLPTFQFGADAFGGVAQGGTSFIAGVNAALLFPLADLLWVGVRPALHYSYDESGPYESTWLHIDAAAQINIVKRPLRVYGLLAGGYLGALDGDLHRGLADGWSVLAGVGAAWQFDKELGIFVELGFRGGRAVQAGERVLDLDDQGRPQCADAECQEYLMKDIDRTFELTAFTINLGITYLP